MLEITEYLISETKITKLSGRLDGVNSEEINKYIITILDKGIRKVVFDFSEVNYVSSAGLRVILINQKKITSAGGEISIYKLTPQIYDVFKMSGFIKIFKIIENDDEFNSNNHNFDSESTSVSEFDNHTLEILSINGSVGKIEIIGSSDKIENSEYDESDKISISANEVDYAFGFATIGDDWVSVKDYFGESFILEKNLFVYPAVKRPAVDFMIYNEEMANTNYLFLNGFKFTGSPSNIVSFKIKDKFVDISDLLDSISNTLELNNFGFSIIAESKGLRGMNMKQVPLKENKPSNENGIFDKTNFSDWVNFPVEQDDFNSIIAGVGFYSNKDVNKSNKFSDVLPGESKFHLHCGIFEKALLQFKTDTYSQNLNTILNELEAKKVQHILSGSLLSIGTLSIIKIGD